MSAAASDRAIGACFIWPLHQANKPAGRDQPIDSASAPMAGNGRNGYISYDVLGFNLAST